MPAIPESTKTSLAQRLRAHAKQKWPQLATVHVRYRGQFAYVEAELADGDRLPLMRLRPLYSFEWTDFMKTAEREDQKLFERLSSARPDGAGIGGVPVVVR